jgi:hypothetical protein
VESAGDFRFTKAEAAQFADLIGVQGGGERSTEALAVLPGVSKPSTNALAEHVSFEFRENCEQPGNGGRRAW